MPDGHVFVAEHAAQQYLWEHGKSAMAFGAPGTGKSFSACKMLTEDKKPDSIAICANTWVQVSGLKKDLQDAKAPDVLVKMTRTRAATFNLGRSDVVPDPTVQGTSQKSRETLKCSGVYADELSQWRPGLLMRYVDPWARQHRGRPGESLGGWQLGAGGGFEQLPAILAKAEYQKARQLGAMPEEENVLEDGTLLDHPEMHVLHFKKVLRQEQERLASAYNNFGMGVVDNEGWAVAQELFETSMSGQQVRLWPFVAQARDQSFERNLAHATGRGLRHGVDYFVHVDANGEKMTEAELRNGGSEEQYVIHKACIVVDVPVLLIVEDGAAAWTSFGDGTTRAYNNIRR